MKKTMLLAAVLATLFTSQVMAAPKIPATPALISFEPAYIETVHFDNSSDMMRAYRNWKKESEAEKIEKEYKKWKKRQSDSNTSSDEYYKQRRKQRDENDRKEYEKWKKKNSGSRKSYNEWRKERYSDKYSKEFEKWKKKHRNDWRKWYDKDYYEDEIFQNVDGGEGDGGGSGGAE